MSYRKYKTRTWSAFLRYRGYGVNSDRRLAIRLNPHWIGSDATISFSNKTLYTKLYVPYYKRFIKHFSRPCEAARAGAARREAPPRWSVSIPCNIAHKVYNDNIYNIKILKLIDRITRVRTHYHTYTYDVGRYVRQSHLMLKKMCFKQVYDLTTCVSLLKDVSQWLICICTTPIILFLDIHNCKAFVTLA